MAANLTQITIYTRKSIRLGIYISIALLILRIAFGIGRGIYLTAFPPGPPPPTLGYGLLPQINFPEPAEALPDLTYTIETPTGDLPALPDQLPVYRMPQETIQLFSLDNAKQRASSLGFTREPFERTPVLFSFTHPEVPATLEMNIVTKVFTTNYNLAFDPTPLLTAPPSEDDAIRTTRNLLSRASSLPEDLSGPVTFGFLRVEGQNLVSAPSLSEGDLIQVNLFRKEYIEGIPSLPPNPLEANVWTLLSGTREQHKQLIATKYHYFPVDESIFETYPIKLAQAAVDELIAGEGYVANLGLNPEGNIVIRRIYLAYYDPNSPQQFFQPIIVFEGDNEFFAYVHAVPKENFGE